MPGKHGRRAIPDLLIGATGEKVIRKTSTPVPLVNPKPSGPCARLLVALEVEVVARRA